MLGGDFNVGDINWDTLSVHPGANQIKVQQGILDILAENHLDQIQHEPSCEDRILDLFITSHPGLIKNCCVIPGISDHDAVITDSNIKPVINKKPAHFIPLYSKANWEQIKKNTINFATDYSKHHLEQSVEENWNLIKNHIERQVKDQQRKFHHDLPCPG